MGGKVTLAAGVILGAKDDGGVCIGVAEGLIARVSAGNGLVTKYVQEMGIITSLDKLSTTVPLPP